MPYMRNNSVELYYERGGEGPPVVFIHGGFASLQLALRDLKPYDWGWELDFAEHFDFVWYDRRGCYRSSRPRDGYSLKEQVNDLRQLLDQLGFEAVHLIGSSAGGPIGMLFTAVYPVRVRSLVLVGTALDLFPSDDKATQLIREQLHVLDQSGPEVAFRQRPESVEVSLDVLWSLEEARARGTLQAFIDNQRLLVEKAKQFSYAERIAWYAAELNNIRAYMDFDLEPYARRIDKPTLILHGSADQAVPVAWSKAMAEAVPASTLHEIEPGSHGLIFRDATARSRTIDFIKEAEHSYQARSNDR